MQENRWETRGCWFRETYGRLIRPLALPHLTVAALSYTHETPPRPHPRKDPLNSERSRLAGGPHSAGCYDWAQGNAATCERTGYGGAGSAPEFLSLRVPPGTAGSLAARLRAAASVNAIGKK
jgi:hypothetical protein